MTLTRTTDHETALAGGFDIVRPGYWVRPDSAAIQRVTITLDGDGPWLAASYIVRRSDGRGAHFYTMREAVEWIGPVRLDPEEHDDCTCPDCMERAEERYAYARDNWYS